MDHVLTFDSEILITGVNPYVHVTSEQAALLKPKWRRPMPVLVQINGTPERAWEINMMPMGNGDFYLYLHGDVRKVSHTAVGDLVNVRVEFNSSYSNGPQHDMPDRLKYEIEHNTNVRDYWQLLPPSRQKEVLRYLANLKSDDALQRNVSRTIHVLKGNDDHFMGRDWKNGK